MPNNNLPAILNRKNGVFNIVKRYMDKLSSKSNNKKIIDNFTNIKQYGVLSMPAFRIMADEMIQKSPTGSIIMADINDLFVANKFRGKEKVNVMIGNIINTIKTNLDESNCINYKLGKMGDEIYIYMPDKDEQEANTIVDKLHEIRENELTISAGASSNLSKGLVNAINEADKNMTINKSKFKSKRLKSLCGNNIDKVVNNVVATQLDKMRINLSQLKNSNKPDLRNTFDKAIEELNVEELFSKAEDSPDTNSSEKEDTFEKQKEKYTTEAKLLYGNNPELIQEYVLANMISKHTVENVVNAEFFQGLGYKQAYKNIKKDKSKTDFDILAMDLSGLKVINDNFGHEEGDKAIADALEHLKAKLKENKTKMYSDIVAKGAGNSYVLIERLHGHSKDKLLTDIQRYGTTKDSNYNMSIICSTQNVDKNNLNKSNFLNIINSNLREVENNLQEQSFNKKLKNVDEIKNSIKKIYQQIIHMDDIQLLLKDHPKQKETVLDMIKRGFENCIEKEKETSHLNISPGKNYIENEIKFNRTRINRRIKPHPSEMSV